MDQQAHQKDFLKVTNKNDFFFIIKNKLTKKLNFTDNDASSKRPESVASSVDCKDSDLDNKNRDSVEIKREGSVQLDDDFHSLPPLKRLRADFVDAESNTTNSGECPLKIFTMSVTVLHKVHL
jgi:hypothetical protein